MNIEEVREQLKENGFTDEDIDNFIASTDPKQNYEFKFSEGKIIWKDINYCQLAEYLIAKYRICSIDESLHTYDSGLYKYLSDVEFDKIVISETHNSTVGKRKEIEAYIKALAVNKTQSDSRYILFQNCVYDAEKDEVLEKDTKFVFCNMIPHFYNKDAKAVKVFDDFLFSIASGDEELVTLYKQMIGYCFMRKNPYQVFFFIVGPGGNGKSTLLRLIEYIIGKENISYIPIQDMQNEFVPVLLKNKLVNIGDDVENSYITGTSILKKVVSGETFLASKKFKDKEPMSFYGKTIFSGNDVPKTSDKTDGIKRRLNVIPMTQRFKGEKRDMHILDKLLTPEVAEYCIAECVKALRDVMENGFIKPKAVEEANIEFAIKNDHILEFAEEKNHLFAAKEAQTIYEVEHINFCNRNGYHPVGRNTFYERMAGIGYKKKQIQTEPGRPYKLKKTQ